MDGMRQGSHEVLQKYGRERRPSRYRILNLLQNVNAYPMAIGIKRSKRETNNSPLHISELKNVLSFKLHPHLASLWLYTSRVDIIVWDTHTPIKYHSVIE
jgi:hypothetical protein